MTIMAKGRDGWCEHYRGLQHETCDAGVKYDDVTDKSTSPRSLPCIQEWNKSGVKCDKCVMPTSDQIAERRAETAKRFAHIGLARAHIVTLLGGPWKKSSGGAEGRTTCPACKSHQSLAFTRSGYNGHIHARCSTPGCVSWME